MFCATCRYEGNPPHEALALTKTPLHRDLATNPTVHPGTARLKGEFYNFADLGSAVLWCTERRPICPSNSGTTNPANVTRTKQLNGIRPTRHCWRSEHTTMWLRHLDLASALCVFTPIPLPPAAPQIYMILVHMTTKQKNNWLPVGTRYQSHANVPCTWYVYAVCRRHHASFTTHANTSYTLSLQGGGEEGSSAVRRGPSAIGRPGFLGSSVNSGCPQQARHQRVQDIKPQCVL